MALEMMDCSLIRPLGSVELQDVWVDGRQLGPLRAQVLPDPPGSVDVVLGLDVLVHVGLHIQMGPTGVCVNLGPPQDDVVIRRQATEAPGAGLRSWAQVVASPALDRMPKNDAVTVECQQKSDVPQPHQHVALQDADFAANFDGKKWTVQWEWEGSLPAGQLQQINYNIAPEAQEAFDQEVQEWVTEGYLVEWNPAVHGAVRNMVPLMCVQQKKGDAHKVRPVLDFRRLNSHIKSRPAAATPLCQERLRQWRQFSGRCAIVDLKRAYLQVWVEPALWTYQAVWWKGQTFLLT